MRSLVTVGLVRDEKHSELATWLTNSGFRPEEVHLADAAEHALRNEERPHLGPHESSLNVAGRHAFEILSTIPREGSERQHALDTAKAVIRFNDAHGNTVWGLMCVDSPIVTFRWRHHLTRSLEQATEELVAKIWASSGTDKTFVESGCQPEIPIREPYSTNDAYYGEVIPPGRRLVERAKRDKGVERKTAIAFGIATIAMAAIGFFTFAISGPNDVLRWVSGSFDRLATGAMATAAVSYLAYRFHLNDLKRKPAIDWK